ncbi:MAG TPA: histidine kinase [Cyanobacteria bacterium UBA8803]|nr:histidine kinase [Cyanobacteria bacterium UBA9273]HBL58324.1 histidine kinase [Cyanobacteria bacterium UBA8803]
MSTSNQDNQQGGISQPLGDRGNLTNPTKSASTNWLNRLQPHSKLLMAVVEPTTFILLYANEAFCRVTGITAPASSLPSQGIRLSDVFPEFDEKLQEQIYRRHLLPLVLRDVYQIEHSQWRFLDEPITISVKSAASTEPSCIQFWLRSEPLKVERIDPQLDEFADLGVSQVPVEEIVLNSTWEERLQLDNYRVTGQLLWEGVDITYQAAKRRLIDILIGRDSVFNPEKLLVVSQKMRSLFRADKSLLLTVKHGQVQVFMGTEGQIQRDIAMPSLESWQGSHFLKAAQANRVQNVVDLSKDCQTAFEDTLVKEGVRSLLLIPLLMGAKEGEYSPDQLVGLVGLISTRPYNFNSIDVSHATDLIPALRVALSQAVQGQFSHIHPAVEWRFLQEAERRSLGLPPEQIVFTNVYPMYGISDIRGSSTDRNTAIQTDLLAQFNLGVAVVEAVSQYQDLAFLQQLRQDLQTQIDRLNKGVMVDAEVTVVQYLKEHLEVYFDYFRQCGEAAVEAVKAYEQACANEHGCVYTARERYDRTILEITNTLRKNWESWQERMQKIVPHYCDVEITDGMDHMIYAGASINPQFSLFHLHALRYEQLRAICDCARTCFRLRDRDEKIPEVTHLVLIQDNPVDIFHDEQTEKLFDLRGSTRDTRYEIVKKRIDKAVDATEQTRITQPGMLTLVYCTDEEWGQYKQYLRYLARDGWVDSKIQSGTVEPLQGITGLKFSRVRILPDPDESKTEILQPSQVAL